MAYFRTYNGHKKLILTAKDKKVGKSRRNSRLGDIKKVFTRKMNTVEAHSTIAHILRNNQNPVLKLEEWIRDEEDHLEELYYRAHSTLLTERTGTYYDGASPTGKVQYPRHSINQTLDHIRYLRYVLKAWRSGIYI